MVKHITLINVKKNCPSWMGIGGGGGYGAGAHPLGPAKPTLYFEGNYLAWRLIESFIGILPDQRKSFIKPSGRIEVDPRPLFSFYKHKWFCVDDDSE